MINNIFYIILIATISSCAFMNEKKVGIPIKSNPSGANVYIDGKYYGVTPIRIHLTPDKNYKATVVKRGYGSANIDMQTWYSVRGGRGSDTTRCVLDTMGMMLILPIASLRSVHCRDFKQKEYIVNIGNAGFSSNYGEGMNLEITDPDGDIQNYRTDRTYSPSRNYGSYDYYQQYNQNGYN